MARDVDPRRRPAPGMSQVAGLFGPSSVTWRLHADPMLGVAGLRALLMQALHPLAAAGVSQHSTFRQDVWGRLASTAEYVGITTYGALPDALTAAARVRAVHAAVHGVDPYSGRPYNADDPELLLWVHACLVDSVLDVLPRAGCGLSAEDADAYVAEQVRTATLVGLEPEDVPDSVTALRETVRRIRPALRVTPAAREEAAYVVAPPMRPAVAVAGRPAWSAVAGVAFASMPPWARKLYALPDLPGAAGLHHAATTVALRALRTSLRGVQTAVPSLREGPHLSAARERLAHALTVVDGGRPDDDPDDPRPPTPLRH